jgi:hypothetical protein
MRSPRWRHRRRVTSAVALILALATPARATSLDLLPPAVGVTELYLADTRSGLALSGLDPVSYWLGPEPRAGRPPLELLHDGLVWRFSSEANRTAFALSPDAFLPRLGGYDAVQVASGLAVTADPRLFVVRAGLLYFFRTPENRERFLAEQNLADAAEARWPALREALVKG